MATTNGVQENYYQQFFGTSSTSYLDDQITGNINDENGLKNEDPHSEQPRSNSHLDTAGRSKNNEHCSFFDTEHEEQAKCRTSEIPDCELHPKSPSERESRSHSKERSRRRSRSSSGSSSSSSRSRSRTCSSRSRSSSRSASRSRRDRRRCSSRSSSRSRSRSQSSRYRRHRSRSYKRHHRSPRRYRSRSRSRSQYYGRDRSRNRSRSHPRCRRYYKFVPRAYPVTFRSWRSRSRTRIISRSRSRSPLRLTETDRRELLEIAKANAAKALGKSVDLPPSLKKDSWLSNTLHKTFEQDSDKLMMQSRNLNNKVPTKVSPQQGENLSAGSAMLHPALHKQGINLERSQKKEEPKKARGQWVPIQCQRSLNRPQ